ncbi:MAG: CpaD family pilus assembly protein [Pararhizobium sp.]
MTVRRPHPPRGALRSPFARRAGVVAVAFAGLWLAGCSDYPSHSITVGAIPDDYRTRHPIVVAEREQTLDVPVASEDHRLTHGTIEMIRGYADRYRQSASGTVRILVPHGSVNAAAASYVAHDVRAVLVRRGVPASRIVTLAYDAAANYGDAPIHLSYLATTASTTPCGVWPSDLAQDTSENRNYENFGCASQNNLAAQIANPSDLLAPRDMTPIDAERRTQVYQDYVKNGAAAGGNGGSIGGGGSGGF